MRVFQFGAGVNQSWLRFERYTGMESVSSTLGMFFKDAEAENDGIVSRKAEVAPSKILARSKSAPSVKTLTNVRSASQSSCKTVI